MKTKMSVGKLMAVAADTLKVLCDRSDIGLEVREDGIYRKRGLMITVR